MGWIPFDRYVTSHVGSLPSEYSEENFERCFKDLVDVGLDVPPIPQLRDFIFMYLNPLVEAGVLRVDGELYKADLKMIDEIASITPVLSELKRASEITEHFQIKWLRVPITGAFTLASRIYLEDPAKGLKSTVLAKPELVAPLSEYVSKVVAEASRLKGSVIVIDEPVLGNIVGPRVILFGYKGEEILEVYNTELRPAQGHVTATHICGQVSERLLDILAESERLNFLNHEFHDTQVNLALPWRKLLERSDKILSPGVFSTKRREVESVDEIINLSRKIIEKVGGEYVNLFTGDCGLRGLKGTLGAYDIALKKLRNLVSAVDALNRTRLK
ncbi:MAG: hypothetical protein QXY49_00620 [Thermofilaceae archaeon]